MIDALILESLRSIEAGLDVPNEYRCKRKTVTAVAFASSEASIVSASRWAFNDPRSRQWTASCTGVRHRCGCPHAEAVLVIDMLRAGVAAARQFLLGCSKAPCLACASLVGRSDLFWGACWRDDSDAEAWGDGPGLLRRAGMDAWKLETL